MNTKHSPGVASMAIRLLLPILAFILIYTATPTAGSAAQVDAGSIDTKTASTTVSLWPRANTLDFGLWSKLGGTVKDGSGDPIQGATVYLQKFIGSHWVWLATVETDETGYFQKWFFNLESPVTYRAEHIQSDTFSNTTTITFDNNISTWNDFRPTTKYAQWTKLRGQFGGPDGPKSGQKIYLQKWNGEVWEWVATVQTDSTGYYEVWFPSYSTGKYRMGTDGSEIVSEPIWKNGSSFVHWKNDKIHAVLRDGYLDPVPFRSVFLQKYNFDKSEWVWEATKTTNETGYVSFAPVATGKYRLGTWASKVTSKHIWFEGYAFDTWKNDKIHGVLKTGEEQIPGAGKIVHLQKYDYDKSQWEWFATGTTSTSGYVGFAPVISGKFRMALEGSKVVSQKIYWEVPQVLTSVSRWITDDDPLQGSGVAAFAKAKDQSGEPIHEAKVVFTWNFAHEKFIETVYTNGDGVAASDSNIGDSPVGRTVVVGIAVTHGEKTINSSVSFTPKPAL